MARVIPIEELFQTHGRGYLERIWLEKSQDITEAEHDIEPCVWIGNHYYDKDFQGFLQNCNGVCNKPSDEEYNELDPDDYQKLICGERIWDNEPTDEEIENTPWREAE